MLRIGMIVMLGLGSWTAQAQVSAGTPPTATRAPARIDPQPPSPVRSRPVDTIPSTLSQRPTPPAAAGTPSVSAAPADAAATPSALQAPPYVRAYDRKGRLIPGAVQTAPGRILDTRSGRYYDTAPIPGGDGQRVRP